MCVCEGGGLCECVVGVGVSDAPLGAELGRQMHSIAVSDVRIPLQKWRDLAVRVERDTEWSYGARSSALVENKKIIQRKI